MVMVKVERFDLGSRISRMRRWRLTQLNGLPLHGSPLFLTRAAAVDHAKGNSWKVSR